MTSHPHYRGTPEWSTDSEAAVISGWAAKEEEEESEDSQWLYRLELANISLQVHVVIILSSSLYFSEAID